MLLKEYKYLKHPVDNLAGLFKKQGPVNVVVLYDPSKVTNVEDLKEKTAWIVGGVKTLKNSTCGFHSVTTSFARKGFGPFVYDLMFSFLNGYLTPDRSSISDKAKNLWNYIFKNRRQEFDIEPIKNNGCKHGFNPYDADEYTPEEDYIDQKYKIASPIDYTELAQAHERFLEFARDKFGYADDVTEQRIIQNFQREFSNLSID